MTILMDIVVCTLDLIGYFTLKAIIHSWVYGVKLELEFAVLNQLVDIAKSGVPGLTTITDDSVPESILTTTTGISSTVSAMPSPDSQNTLKPGGWWIPQAPVYPGADTISRRMSAPVPQSAGLGSIPEGEIAQGQNMTFEQMMRDTGPLSLEGIGVIPEP